METGQALRTLEGHSGFVEGMAVSADGQRAVSASDDKTLKVWDVETGALIATATCDMEVHSCAIIGHGRLIAGEIGGVSTSLASKGLNGNIEHPELSPWAHLHMG